MTPTLRGETESRYVNFFLTRKTAGLKTDMSLSTKKSGKNTQAQNTPLWLVVDQPQIPLSRNIPRILNQIVM